MLADACKKHDMLLSLYYSCPDWNHPCGYNPNASHQWIAKNKYAPNLLVYFEYIKNQITELLTNYGKIYSFFWDIPPRIKDESFNNLIRELQPGIYINNRGFDEGDFSTPEREYGTLDNMRFEYMTEACNSLGEQSWGYRRNEDFYTIKHIRCSVDRIMALGGSYLLNVGSRADGVIDDEYLTRLEKVGDWYNRMEGCLEETEKDTFDYDIKKNEYIVNKKNGKSYFHFYNGIISSAVSFKKFPSNPKSVRLMNTNRMLDYKIEVLPEYPDCEGKCITKYLHITGIPADDLSAEPIVIEVEW
jgi:alpha-L-fucosidase